MIRAILFDFDGVLADTEPIHLKAFRSILSRQKISLSEKEYLQKYLGRDDRWCLRELLQSGGKALTQEKVEDLVRQKHKEFLKGISARSVLRPGIGEVIPPLKQWYYLGIVSGAERVDIDAVFQQANLQEWFPVIISANDVERTKPDPGPYLEAVRVFNRDFVPESERLVPAECVAVEDTPWGIEAGRRAGMMTIGLVGSYPEERLREADRTIGSLKEIHPLLETLKTKT